MPQTRPDQIVRDGTQLRLTGGQPRHPGTGQEPYERLGVLGRPPPGQPGQDKFAARQIAAGVPQIGGHHTAYGPVELVPATEQPQAQRIGFQQCAQPHLVAADLFSRPG